MRIAMASTFPPAECGIGKYCEHLVRSLHERSVEVAVLAEGVAWSRRGDWAADIARALERNPASVLHVQHEESIFGQDDRLAVLFDRARALGTRTVVTLHSVYDSGFPRSLFIPGRSFHRRLARSCDAFVVHQGAGMANVLIDHGVPSERVHVIAHGTPQLALPDRTEARAALGLPPDAPIALFFGFIHRGKNVDVAVRAFERLVTRHPEAKLVIAGKLRSSIFGDGWYASTLLRLMARGIEEGRIIYHPGFVPEARKPLYYAAADVIVLPHHQAYGSASGVLHEAMGARLPAVCARGKKFAELVERIGATLPAATPGARDVDAWEHALERLLFDADAREVARATVARLAAETSWNVSGERHAGVYRALARGTQDLPAGSTARQ